MFTLLRAPYLHPQGPPGGTGAAPTAEGLVWADLPYLQQDLQEALVEFAKIGCVSVERSNFLRSRRPRFEFLRVVGLKGIRWRWRARVLGSCSLRAGD
jgi:hypothetical protein